MALPLTSSTRFPCQRFTAGLRCICLAAGWLLAVAASAHGAFHDRLPELVAALERNPHDAQLHYELATVFCQHGDWALALGYAESADELRPDGFPTDLVRGEALLGAGRPAAARVALDRHLAAHPRQARAWVLRARAMAACDGAAAALPDFRAALAAPEQREPDHARETAAALAACGEQAEAIAVLRHAIAEFGAEPELLLAALELETKAADWSAALTRIADLQQTAPRPEPWMARRAEILAQAGRTAEAKAAWAALRSRLEALPNLERGTRPLAELAARATAATENVAPSDAVTDDGAPRGSPPTARSPAVMPTAPAADTTGLGSTTTLSVTLAELGGGGTVTFYGRKTVPPTPGPDFAIGTLPDTQYYSENLNNRSAAYFAQTRWYVENRDTLNFAFVSHMGDIVNNGDLIAGVSNLPQWLVADTAMKTLENPALTLRAHGIPWGGAPGNHDQTPNGNPTGTTTYFNQFFGVSRFAGRTYYGGHFGPNNDNNYELFSVSGLDFIIVHLEYDARAPGAYQAVLDWADALLQAHPHRRAIVTSHWIVNTGNPASFSPQGQAIYQRLRGNPNLFLLLCGHVAGEGRRSDSYEGRTVYSILQDYQGRNGGDGWLRYYVFSPARNTIAAKTFSPVLNRSESDADSEFTLPCNLQAPVSDWVPLGTLTVPPNATAATLDWEGLERGSYYEWYAEVRDASSRAASTTLRFATASPTPPTIELTSPATAEQFNVPASIRLAANASATAGGIARVEFYQGETRLGEDTTAPYEFTWSGTWSGTYVFSAVAIDTSGASALSRLVPITLVNPNNRPPTVTMVGSPAEARLMSPAAVTLTASASDADGVIVKVEFLAGSTKLGERTSVPFTFPWTGAASGTYLLTARATDNDGGVTTSAPVTVTVVEPVVTTLVARNAVWQYLDDGSNQGTAWRAAGFDDARWAAGFAELGYGDGDEATVVGFGPNPANRAVTTYFRHTFTVADPSTVSQLALNILRDDGAIVYLNGTEIGRSAMAAGTTYLFNTAAPTATDGADERTFFPLAFTTDPARLLVRGVNTLAVEVHQQSVTSSDLSFNLELLDRRLPVRSPPTVALTSPGAGATFIAPATIPLAASAADADGVVTKVEFLLDGVKIGAVARPPYSVTCDEAAAGYHTLTAVATDNDGNFIATPPLTVIVRDADPGRFVNFSVRSQVETGSGTLIVGFVTGGGGTSGTKPLLLRAIGPALGAFGVSEFVADPTAALYNGTTLVAANDNWSGSEPIRAMNAQVGAFSLADPASRDAAMVTTRAAGPYTLWVNGAAGVALAEIYDGTPAASYRPTTPRLINVSVRTLVGPGNDILIAGFVVGGSTDRTVLIRGVGPGLTSFGVGDALADPRLQVFRGGNATPIAGNNDWGGTALLVSVFARAGAFGLQPTSRDAALVLRVTPGAYTAQLSSATGAAGVVLLDIYEVP